MFVVLNWPQLLPYLAMMKLKFSFHLIWTFFVNISHAELSSWPKSAFSHLSASQVTSLASHPPLPPGLPPRSRSRSRYVCSPAPAYFNNPELQSTALSLSLRAPVLVTALSTHAHSRSSVSCQTRLRVSKLCRWPGSQRTLKCRPPLFCARCLLYMCSKFLNKMLTETDWKRQHFDGNLILKI